MKNLGVWIGIIILLFSALIFWQSTTYKIYSDIGPGPGLFPLLLSGLLGILAIAYIVSSLTKNKIYFKDAFPTGKRMWQVGRIFLAVVLFIVLSPYIGFTVTGILVLCLLFLGEMKWYSAVGISIATTLAVFITFKTLLGVPLPVNVFGW